MEIIDKLYHNRLISRLFHTMVYCLKRELTDCYSVLDLGCGPDSPIKYCRVPFSVGVDVFEPYIQASKKKKIHIEYLLANITDLNFEPESFDAVILTEVLEHLPKEYGKVILEKVETWAKKKVIITTPNGYIPQLEMSENPYQIHRSGWNVDEMKAFGYKPNGMAGWKFLRKENTSENMQDKEAIFSTIRYHPRIFWLIISEFTQVITYYLPKLAFEVFYVKNLERYKYDTFNPYIFAEIPAGKKILDIGCGTGLLGKRLRKERRCSFLAGIEKDLEMAEVAKLAYDEVIIANLDKIRSLPFEKGYFDIIVCSDVLEHLRNPLEVLKTLSAYLSEEGFFLISIPNISFFTIRLSLLFGRFDYQPQGGILDESHLRFFTRKSFVNLLKKANLEPYYIRGYNLVQRKFFILKVLGLLFPTLFSIQFLIKAKKIG